MQMTMAILALALSAGFIFWVGVLCNLLGEKSGQWQMGLAILTLTVAAIAFAFLAGRAWP